MKKIKIFVIAAIVAAILLTGCEDREMIRQTIRSYTERMFWKR